MDTTWGLAVSDRESLAGPSSTAGSGGAAAPCLRSAPRLPTAARGPGSSDGPAWVRSDSLAGVSGVTTGKFPQDDRLATHRVASARCGVDIGTLIRVSLVEMLEDRRAFLRGLRGSGCQY